MSSEGRGVFRGAPPGYTAYSRLIDRLDADIERLRQAIYHLTVLGVPHMPLVFKLRRLKNVRRRIYLRNK